MRKAKLCLGAAAVLQTLSLLGCGADYQYNPGPPADDPSLQGGGGDVDGPPKPRGSGGSAGAGEEGGSGGAGGAGGGAVTADPKDPADGDGIPAGIGNWAAGLLGGNGGTGGGGGAGGAGGAGGGPPPDPPANDGCLGEPVALSQGFTVHIDGTLTGAADDLTTFCGDELADPGNPDVVYQLDVAADISLNIQVATAAFDPALSLRLLTCTVESSGDACLDFGASAESTSVSLATGTYWIVVDSADGNVGDFTLDLVATAPACGDGVLNAGEQCDEGGAAADDGCFDPGHASECTFGEAPASSDSSTCPGLGPTNITMSADPQNPTITRLGPHHNGAGGHVYSNDVTVDPEVCGWSADGPENVFRVVPQSSGTLFARIGYDDQGGVICDSDPMCGDFILYMREASCEPLVPADPLQQLACVDFDVGFQEILEIQAPVTGSNDYYVFVDGLDDTWGVGTFYLELWLVP